MKLYAYWRSTTSYRVRIALNLKGLTYEIVPVDLVAGAQRAPDFLRLNPGAGVPVLVLDDGSALTQSLAILDYLDHLAPEPPTLPAEALLRARVLAAADVVATDIHPVNNLKVVNRLKAEFGASTEASVAWMRHWMVEGFRALEAMLSEGPAFSFADTPLLSDICIVPQLYNARRWDVDLGPFPRLRQIEKRALSLPAFDAARPENQPDAP